MGSNRTDRLIKNSVILSFGTLIPKVLTVLVLPLLTTFLTTSEYGNYDLVLSATSLIVPVAMMQIQQAAFRFLLATTETDEIQSYIATSLFFVLALSLVSSPITFVVGICIGLNYTISVVMCLLVLAESVYLLLGQVMRGIGKNACYSFGVIVYAIVNSVCLCIFIPIFNMGLFGVILSLVIAYVGSAIIMFVLVFREYRVKFSMIDKDVLKKMLAFSVPIVPSSISLWIVNLSDRFVIVYFLGTAANGIYSVANRIPALYTTAYNIFNLAWTETATQVADEEKHPEVYYTELFKKLYSFLVGVMVIIMACSPLFYKIFINEQYYESYYQTAILYFSVFFNSLVMFYAGIYIALKRTKQVGYSSAAGAIINLVVNLLLVRHIGLYAASVSTLVSYLTIVLYRYWDIKKYISIKYDYKKILVGLLVMIVCSVLYYQRNYCCYAICILFAVLYNWFENKYMIRYIFKKLKNRISITS